MKRVFLSLIAAIAVLAVTVALLAWFSWQSPPWYVPPDFSDPEVSKLADRAEYHFNEELHKVRPTEEVWRIRIGDVAMNAWLSGRLEAWLTHDQKIALPPEIHAPQVHVTDGGIWTYAEVEITEDSPRPLGIKWWIWIDEGKLLVEPISIRLGTLPLPMIFFDRQLAKLRKEMLDVRAIIPLLDDRSVEVQHISFENGSFVLTCRTVLK